jgi:hypothetical protein
MKKLNVLLAFVIFASLSMAHASDPVKALETHNDFSFTISSVSDWGNETLYNADSVEQFTESFLTQLGATHISVNVPSAGMNELVWNPTVYVSFDSLRKANPALVGTPRDADWKTVTLKGSDNGIMAQAILDGVKDHFDFTVTHSSPTSGLESSSPYDYEVNVLVAH